MKILKKIFFGIVVASALFAIAYVLMNTYDKGVDPIELYKSYTNYVCFLYGSIIIFYLCATTHSRLSAMTIILLALVHFFRLASFFTKGALGITTIEFYALIILFGLALAVASIRNRIRFPLILIVSIPFVVILLNHTLPLYPDKPDLQGFYDAQTTTLYTQTKDTAKTLQDAETKITITTDKTEKILIPGQSPRSQEIGTTPTQIVFSSKTGIQDTYVYIAFPKGASITLYPQSAIAIEGTQIDIIQGTIGTYVPEERSGYLSLTGNLTKMMWNDTGKVQDFIQRFAQEKEKYFIERIGGEIMLNPTIDTFIGRYLNFTNSVNKALQKLSTLSSYLSFLSFSSFDQNILNYDEFHTYLKYQTRQTYEAVTGSTQRIARDTQKGWNASNTKGRWDTIQNAFNNIFKK